MIKKNLFFIVLILIGCNRSDKTVTTVNYTNFIVRNIIESDNFTLPSYYKLKDEQGNGHSIDSIFINPLLVFRFSELNCEYCIKTEIELINKLKCRNKIIGLATFSNNRLLLMAKKKYNINFPVYSIPFQDCDLLPEILEEDGNPYLFVMSSNMQSKHVFLPDKIFPEISMEYYNAICNILDDKKSDIQIFNNNLIDIGTIKNHEVQEIKFKYTNSSSENLIINDVKVSCGCTVPHWEKKPLKEKESSALTVLFTPETLGYNSKIVMVYHNQSKDPVKLIFKANVEE